MMIEEIQILTLSKNALNFLILEFIYWIKFQIANALMASRILRFFCEHLKDLENDLEKSAKYF